MLDNATKRRIDTARDILVGKVPDPKSQVEQITIALIYKFMDDMDAESEEYEGKRSFFSGEFEKYGWSRLMAPDMGGYDVLNLYSEAIQKMTINPNIPQLFLDIFKNAYLPYRDPETLKSFLKVIDDFEYDHSERLGDAFEYLLSVLGSQGKAGQFRTPRHIIDFMVEVINPGKNDTIIDPACGTAGFLISSYKYILQQNAKDGKPGAGLTPDERSRLSQNIEGYDISPDMVRLSLVNMYLHGFSDPHIFEYDTLTSEDRWYEFADVILANPPFMSPRGGIKPHKRFSVQSKRSEVLFVDYIAEHLSPSGRAAVIVPEGIIFQSGTAYKKLRKMLVENFLFGVVSLPAGVFNPYSGVKTSILLMDKTLAKKTGNIIYVKIENDGFDLGAQRRPIVKNDFPDALKHIKAYIQSVRNGEEFDAENIHNALVVEKEKIGENGDWNLSGERYKKEDIRSSNYKLVRLGDVSLIEKGTSITKKNAVHGKYPVIAGGQKPAYYHNEYNREGQIITVSASGAYAGFVNFFEKPIFASDCSTIKSKEDNVLTKFLYLLLKLNQERIYTFQQGGGQPHVYPKDLIPLQIPLPPLEIQKEIVAEIEGYQKIIDGARQVVENYKPHIKIDPEWEMVEFEILCKVVRGSSPRPKRDPRYYGGDVPRLMVADITRDGMFTTPKIDFLTKEGAKKSRPMKKGEVILTVSGNPGLPTILAVDAHIHDGFAGIKDLDINLITPKFLYFVLLMKKDTHGSQSVGAVFRNLNTDQIRKFKIPLPPLETQNRIVAQIEKEQELVKANKELIKIYEQKIKDKIAGVWD